jgi:hypothetical protein
MSTSATIRAGLRSLVVGAFMSRPFFVEVCHDARWMTTKGRRRKAAFELLPGGDSESYFGRRRRAGVCSTFNG